jgi:hypothetical protein
MGSRASRRLRVIGVILAACAAVVPAPAAHGVTGATPHSGPAGDKPPLHLEREPAGSSGHNDMPASAEPIGGFGTGPHERAVVRIAGSLVDADVDAFAVRLAARSRLSFVTRVVVGGSIAEAVFLVPTIGVAESIDPGNFALEESALVLLDLLSGPPEDPTAPLGGQLSLNHYLTPASDRIGFIGRVLGETAAHEAPVRQLPHRRHQCDGQPHGRQRWSDPGSRLRHRTRRHRRNSGRRREAARPGRLPPGRGLRGCPGFPQRHRVRPQPGPPVTGRAGHRRAPVTASPPATDARRAA